VAPPAKRARATPKTPSKPYVRPKCIVVGKLPKARSNFARGAK
jgi:hypothetical protein